MSFLFCFLTFPALSMLGTMSGLYAIPWCKESLLLTILMSVIGGSMGILDTGRGPCALTVLSAKELETSSIPKQLLFFLVIHLELKEGSCFTWLWFLD